MIQITITKVPDTEEIKTEIKIEGEANDCMIESLHINKAEKKVHEQILDQQFARMIDEMGKALFK